jgi:glycosyltransferase involved in cell wall biosynthesis
MILTHNNARTIARTVASVVSLADDIVVVDDHSTDDTVAMVRAWAPRARVFTRALNHDFAAQRNFALDQVHHDWVLVIDSDEELSPQLAESIRQALQNPCFDGYTCTRHNPMFDRYLPMALGRALLCRRQYRFTSALHERQHIPQLGMLAGPLWHHSWEGLAHWMDDLRDYARQRARLWRAKGYRYGLTMLTLRVLVSVPFFFFKTWLVDGKWRAGRLGLLYALGCAAEWVYTGLFYYEFYLQHPHTPHKLP